MRLFAIIIVLTLTACKIHSDLSKQDPCDNFFGVTKILEIKVKALQKVEQPNLKVNVLHYRDTLAIEGVKMVLTKDRNVVDSLISTAAGICNFSLETGQFDLRISLAEFQKLVIQKIPISLDSSTHINVLLGPDCSETIKRIYNGVSWNKNSN